MNTDSNNLGTDGSAGGGRGGSGAWTSEQLELFHDGELAPELAERLAADLRVDAGLREQLTEVVSLDRAARRVLMTPPVERATRRAAPLGLVLGGVLTLAAAALAIMLWARVAPMSKPMSGASGVPVATDDNPDPSESLPGSDNHATLERAGVRVLASLTVPGKAKGEPKPQRVRRPSVINLPEADAVPEATEPPPSELQNLLATGDVEAFIAKTKSASPEERDSAFGLLGGTLRSAMTAQRVLDSLSPTEQLAICAVWAKEPRLRPVTFERLALLQERPELRERVAALAAELSRTRELLAWMKSYGIDGTAPANPDHLGVKAG